MKDGAFDFIQKPFNKTTVLKIVRKALEKRNLVHENRMLHEKLKNIQGKDTIIGKAAPSESNRACRTGGIKLSHDTYLR